MPNKWPYQNPGLPIAQRVADLVSRMNREEKVGQMMQLDARGDLDHIILERFAGSILHTSPEALKKAHDLVSKTRLGIVTARQK